MKKKISKIFLFILFGLTFLILNNPTGINADAGFDGSYGGGSSSGSSGGGWGGSSGGSYGGSSSSSGNSYNYSGGSADPDVVIATLLSVGLLIFFVILIHIAIAKESERREYLRRNPPIDTTGMPVDEQLNEYVFNLYKEVNIAWMNKDLDPVKHLLTDDLYNMYLMQMDTLIENNQTNVMENFKFVSGHIYSRRRYKGTETVTMIFRVKCNDYITDERGKVIRGKKHVTRDYTYELKLVRKCNSTPLVCPNCGYTLKVKDGVTCPSCNTILHDNNEAYRLANKDMLRQIDGDY